MILWMKVCLCSVATPDDCCLSSVHQMSCSGFSILLHDLLPDYYQPVSLSGGRLWHQQVVKSYVISDASMMIMMMMMFLT